MEYLLMELFGGGTADWGMIGETHYDWHDIMEMAKDIFGSIESIDFQCLLETIFIMAKDEFVNMVDKFIKGKDYEEYKNVINKLKNFDFDNDENWYFNLNYLDNDIIINVDEDIKEILDLYFEDEIDKINDNIGFTYIQINVE